MTRTVFSEDVTFDLKGVTRSDKVQEYDSCGRTRRLWWLQDQGRKRMKLESQGRAEGSHTATVPPTSLVKLLTMPPFTLKDVQGLDDKLQRHPTPHRHGERVAVIPNLMQSLRTILNRKGRLCLSG